jgi:nucleotide-binding universal stress UspA family protein
MFQHLVVPIDGSDASWSAVPIAAAMADAVDGKLDVVTVLDRDQGVGRINSAHAELSRGLKQLGTLAVTANPEVLASDSVASAIAEHVEALSGATVVMSSHGHGRSAAVLGNVADEVLRHLFGPIVVVGPQVDTAKVGAESGFLSADYVVAVDGSEASERIMSIAEAWIIEFGARPWVVEVVDPSGPTAPDVFESVYPARLAQKMQTATGREVEFEVLHGAHPAASIVDFAKSNEAALIFATTHGRTGMARLRAGSVAADIVRHSHCPVVLYRPKRCEPVMFARTPDGLESAG